MRCGCEGSWRGSCSTSPRLGHDRAASPERTDATEDADPGSDDGPSRAIPAARRRRAAETLIAVWMDVVRDLALVGSGGSASVRDPDLLDESRTTADGLDPEDPARFLARLERGAELVAGNVSPELVLDSLVLAAPARRAA